MSRAHDVLDEEATIFALELLMPEDQFRAAGGYKLDLADDRGLELLARRFKVPLAAVVQRIGLQSKGRGRRA